MSVVIVGGGLGGLRTAEALRTAGYQGPVTVVGAEAHHPYNRPPLSKEGLAKGIDAKALEFPRKSRIDDVEWLLGTAVVSADLRGGTLTLDDGRELRFDGLVAATGLRSRKLPIAGPDEGRYALRTVENGTSLRSALTPGARLVVIGAGFIGCEVAATSRGLGAEVTCVAIEDEPMERALGPMLGAELRRRHESHGVGFRMGTGVEELLGSEHVEGVRLSTGEVLPADLVLEAVGSATNVGWLEGNGLDLADGVACDEQLRVLADGTALPNVFAVGDIVRFPNLRFTASPQRVEHWAMPTDTGRHAGRRLAEHLLGTAEASAPPCAPLPSFWSDQYDIALQSFGMPGLGPDVRVLAGELSGEVVLGYYGPGDDGHEQLMAIVALGMLKDVMALRDQVGRPVAA